MHHQQEGYSLTVIRRFPQADICTVAGYPGTIMVRAQAPYIPLAAFREVFDAVASLASDGTINTVVFDKRSLTVFHQPSMEWYFLEWKEAIAAHGVTRHRKLLPDDEAFQLAARLGKEGLTRGYPGKKFQQLDIRYAESLQEALES
jgi:hypothetical protein